MMENTIQVADGTRLFYRDEGQGPVLLALAGLTRSGRDFDYLARHLSGVRLLRPDSRGRGRSDWAKPGTYNIIQEAEDALALLDRLKIEKVAIIGTSRGGMLALMLTRYAPERVAGICFNDIGPVIERAGLLRIGRYLCITPRVATVAQAADHLRASHQGFEHVPWSRWIEEARLQFKQCDGHIQLGYDPALHIEFDTALSCPLRDAWPFFDACDNIPLALLRGVNSDVLSRATLAEMKRRRPDILTAEIPDRGHCPFLDEPRALKTIDLWLQRCFPGSDVHTNPYSRLAPTEISEPAEAAETAGAMAK